MWTQADLNHQYHDSNVMIGVRRERRLISWMRNVETIVFPDDDEIEVTARNRNDREEVPNVSGSVCRECEERKCPVCFEKLKRPSETALGCEVCAYKLIHCPCCKVKIALRLRLY